MPSPISRSTSSVFVVPARPSAGLLAAVGVVLIILCIAAVALLWGDDLAAGLFPTVTQSPASTLTPSLTYTPSDTCTLQNTFTPSIASTITIDIPNPQIGSTWMRPQDGMMMVYVPAGEFTMGIDADDALVICEKYLDGCDRLWYTDEEPVHTVYLDAYWIDSTEVTNAMYARFLNDRGNKIEGGELWLDKGSDYVRIHQSGETWVADTGYEDHPVFEVIDSYLSEM